jgi:hypothetical protein
VAANVPAGMVTVMSPFPYSSQPGEVAAIDASVWTVTPMAAVPSK